MILEYLQNNNIKIDSFISASAIGYYGAKTSDIIHKENVINSNDFLGNLCKEWEEVTYQFKKLNLSNRIIILRFGIILSNQGGALMKMILPIKYYMGSNIGSGKQFMPWIHINDTVNIIDFAISNKNMSGVFNTIAPEHISNKDFTTAIAKLLKKPIFLPNTPTLIFKLIFGEMSTMLTKGSRVSSQKIQDYGYKFRYPILKIAIKELLG